MNTQKPSIAVVGLRNIGKNHCRKLAALDTAVLAALSDTDESRLSAAATEFGVSTTYPDLQGVLEDSSIDGVVLAVPNHLHAPLAIKAMEAGKHVLVEKPMCMNTAEAEEMIKVRDRTKRILMVGMNQRFQPAIAGARKMIADGTIGTIQYVRTRWNLTRPFAGLWERGDWFLKADTSGGGPLLDMGIHRLDLAMFLIGFPDFTEITGSSFYGIGREVAKQRGKVYDNEDFAAGMVRLDTGAALLLEGAYFMNAPAPTQVTEIFGDKGYFITGDGKQEMAVYKGEEPEVIDLIPDDEMAGSPAEHFVRVLRGEEEVIPTPEQGLTGLRIIEGIYKASKRSSK